MIDEDNQYIIYSLLYTCSCDRLPLGLNLAIYGPMLVLQLFIWIVFIIITCVLCNRSRKAISEPQEMTSSLEEWKKNLTILALLFTFLGLPWLLITAGAIFGNENEVFVGIATITDLLQGPALFLLRGVRLREVRQFWRQLLCCEYLKRSPANSVNSVII